MKEEISGLILKHLQGTLSNEEACIFYDWIELDKYNKIFYFEIKALYDEGKYNANIIDIEHSWEKLLRKKISYKENKNIWRTIISYAAIVALAIALTSFYFIFNKDNSPKLKLISSYIGGDGLNADIIVLPDGTRVSLGSKTNFSYDPDYGKKERNVYLEGEAFFDVKQQKDKPFIVNAKEISVKALGTSFNIMAYPGDSLLIATLLEGSISIAGKGISPNTVLTPNQQFVFNYNKSRSNVSNVYADDYTKWTSGYYYFEEQSLKAILHRLSYVYGITFDIKSKDLKDKIFTGTFYRGQNPKDIMEIINLSHPIKYRIDERHVTIF
jgi:ferric-dicitrate binding protein FerR (iron transport regulator)